MSGSVEVLRGTLDLMILRSLDAGPRHGYAIAGWIREGTREVLLVEDGALYPALHRLTERGFIAAAWGVTDTNRRARFYTLTDSGRRQLSIEMEKWMVFSRALSRLVREGGETG